MWYFIRLGDRARNACETTGRQARLIELDPKYVDVIVKRWQDYADRKAVLESDGREFEQITVERS